MNSLVEKWGVFEWSGDGHTEGNPFTDYTVEAVFLHKEEQKKVKGFYDGNGKYMVRFMPSFEGTYQYCIKGNFSEEIYEGEFTVVAPTHNNHGPVRVKEKYHFAYEDGTPYYSIGTTCYVWELQSDELIEQTYQSLTEAKFNKIRFCIFPKHYDYNIREPRSYPYEGTPIDNSKITSANFMEYMGKTEGNEWDFTRFNVEHFQHIEKCIKRLCDLGIEADIIVFHPYDRWGFSQMTRDEDILYIEYLINRFSAYRNVWWAMANEYDLFEHKNAADWNYIGMYFMKNDPYNHLRSIHNCIEFYDHSKVWITHCSIQRQDLYKAVELTTDIRKKYEKPVVFDEIAYEGDIQFGWGNITGEEMLRRFWEAAVRGAYPGHGETFYSEDNILWWSHGGTLKGESFKRFDFLHDIICQTPGHGLKEDKTKKEYWDCTVGMPENDELAEKTGYRLFYFGFMRPALREFYFDEINKYQVEVIDTWNMTITKVGEYKGKFKIDLPAKQYIAVRIMKIE